MASTWAQGLIDMCVDRMTSRSCAGAMARWEEQARTLGYGCPTIWLQEPHSFISFVGGNY